MCLTNFLTTSSNTVSWYCSSGDPESTHFSTTSESYAEYVLEFDMTTRFVDSCLNSHVVSDPYLSRLIENLSLRCPDGQPMREVMAMARDEEDELEELLEELLELDEEELDPEDPDIDCKLEPADIDKGCEPEPDVVVIDCEPEPDDGNLEPDE